MYNCVAVFKLGKFSYFMIPRITDTVTLSLKTAHCSERHPRWYHSGTFEGVIFADFTCLTLHSPARWKLPEAVEVSVVASPCYTCDIGRAQSLSLVSCLKYGWWLFFSWAKIWGQGWTGHFPPALFFFSFFLTGNQLARTKFTFYVSPSTVLQRDKMNVNECSLTSCVWAHSPDRFPPLPGQHSQPTLTSLGQGCMHVLM